MRLEIKYFSHFSAKFKYDASKLKSREKIKTKRQLEINVIHFTILLQNLAGNLNVKSDVKKTKKNKDVEQVWKNEKAPYLNESPQLSP